MEKLRFISGVLVCFHFLSSATDAQFRNTVYQLQASPSSSVGQANAFHNGIVRQNGHLDKRLQQHLKGSSPVQFQQGIPQHLKQQQQIQQEINAFGIGNSGTRAQQQAAGFGVPNPPRGLSEPVPTFGNGNLRGNGGDTAGGVLQLPNGNRRPGNEERKQQISGQGAQELPSSRPPAYIPPATKISFNSLQPMEQHSQIQAQISSSTPQQLSSTLSLPTSSFGAEGSKGQEQQQTEKQGQTTSNQFPTFSLPNSLGLPPNLPSPVAENTFRMPPVNTWNTQPHLNNNNGNDNFGVSGGLQDGKKFESHRFKVTSVKTPANAGSSSQSGTELNSSFKSNNNDNTFKFPLDVSGPQDSRFGSLQSMDTNFGGSSNIGVVYIPEKPKNTVKKGTFSWTSPNGQVYDVTYVANSSTTEQSNANNPNHFFYPELQQIPNNLDQFGTQSTNVHHFAPRR